MTIYINKNLFSSSSTSENLKILDTLFYKKIKLQSNPEQSQETYVQYYGMLMVKWGGYSPSELSLPSIQYIRIYLTLFSASSSCVGADINIQIATHQLYWRKYSFLLGKNKACHPLVFTCNMFTSYIHTNEEPVYIFQVVPWWHCCLSPHCKQCLYSDMKHYKLT